eukprot:Polyplicarium_translucidae@DN1975_c0_g1_i5.p1
MNWQGILNLSTRLGQNGDVQRPSDDDQQWLSEAFQTFAGTAEDPLQALRGALTKAREGDVEVIVQQLDIIERLLENHPELARSLPKTGAVEPLLALLMHDAASVVERTAEILSAATAHNPDLQDAFHNAGALDLLLAMRESKSGSLSNPRVLGFLSSLVRHSRAMEEDFVNRGGVLFLAALLAEPDASEQALGKAATLLRHLLHEGRISMSQVSDAMLAEGVVALLDRRFDEVQLGENSASLARELVTRYRIPLAKENSLNILRDSVGKRVTWLRLKREKVLRASKAAGTEFWDAHDVEIEVLAATDKILCMPLPRTRHQE